MSEDRDLDDAVLEEDLDQEDLDNEDPSDDADDELPEDEPDEEDADEAEPAGAQRTAQPSRGNQRIQALNERARLAEERAAAAERRAEEAMRRQNTEDFRRQEQERLEQMSPDERVNYLVTRAVAPLQFQTWDTNDRITFDGLASRNPAVAAIKDDVEQVFQERVKAGAAVDRTTIAKYLIGERALAKAPRAKAAGARAAAAGRERNSVRPPAARSDVATSGRGRMSEQEARRKRLDGVEI